MNESLRVSIAGTGRFYFFELAEQLRTRSALADLYTGLPTRRIPPAIQSHAHTFPWLTVPRFALGKTGAASLMEASDWPIRATFDRWLASKLRPCDVLVVQSGCGVHAFKAAHEMGAVVTCERGSSHIGFQDEIVADEYARHGHRPRRINPRIVERELREYDTADLIVVPSTFAQRTFVARGVPAERVAVLPLGVNLSIFGGDPASDGIFRVVYVGTMSLRKGLPYLLDAVAGMRDVELLLIGPADPELHPLLARAGSNVRYVGPKSRHELASYLTRSSVFVLPSIEDGFGLVMAEAMACGLPVIASEHTGASDLFTHGREGFIVPIRDAEAIRERIVELRDQPDRRSAMSEAARQRVQELGGWDSYGEQALALYRTMRGERVRRELTTTR